MKGRVLAGLLTLAVAIGLTAPAPAMAQRAEVRFPITGVGDSTITFSATQRWVQPGVTGIIVDPTRQDALMGRFRVLSARSGRATAVITAEAGQIVPSFIAILEEPKQPLYRSSSFLLGLLLGAIVGGVVGASL